MSTSNVTIDYILDQTTKAGRVSARKMFGEYALYCDEKVVGLVCDNTLYIKITDLITKRLWIDFERAQQLLEMLRKNGVIGKVNDGESSRVLG